MLRMWTAALLVALTACGWGESDPEPTSSPAPRTAPQARPDATQPRLPLPPPPPVEPPEEAIEEGGPSEDDPVGEAPVPEPEPERERDPEVEAIIEAMRDPDHKLERGGGSVVVSEEVQLRLGSSDPVVRQEAIREIPAAGPGLDPLMSALAEDPDPEVRAAAAAQLAASGSFGAVTGLLLALQDASPFVIISVLGALELSGDETLVPEIAPLLEHPDPDVRRAAARAIQLLE